MKRLLVALVALAWLPTALAQRPHVATAHLDPIGGSGITADLTFIDNGRTLRIFGQGRFPAGAGQDNFLSVVYDANAESTGPRACIPSSTPITTDQMQAGLWAPQGGIRRTLQFVKTGSAYLPLDQIGPVSVRRMDQTGATIQLVLQACGAVIPR